jgi:hypothetical protein
MSLYSPYREPTIYIDAQIVASAHNVLATATASTDLETLKWAQSILAEEKYRSDLKKKMDGGSESEKSAE